MGESVSIILDNLTLFDNNICCLFFLLIWKPFFSEHKWRRFDHAMRTPRGCRYPLKDWSIYLSIYLYHPNVNSACDYIYSHHHSSFPIQIGRFPVKYAWDVWGKIEFQPSIGSIYTCIVYKISIILPSIPNRPYRRLWPEVVHRGNIGWGKTSH